MAEPVLIIGGGIGGLTAALALVRRGIACEVHERAAEIREIGAGLGLWPGALRVFDELGVGDEVRALGGVLLPSGLRDQSGSALVRLGEDDLCSAFPEPPIGVHRGELQRVLLDALPVGIVHVGRELVGLDGVGADARPGTHVTARFGDGTQVSGRAVVGADGLRSVVRSLIHGPGQLHDCGYSGWRGTMRPDAGVDLDDCWGEWWGRRARFGFLPIGGGRLTWYGTVRDVRTGSLEEAAERFSAFAPVVSQVIAGTSPDALWVDRVRDRAPLRRWSVGAVTLLGDAAHPMTPELGQGACQAIVDAAALAEELAAQPDAAAAFSRYERRRRRRTAVVQRAARFMAWGGNIEAAPLQRVRTVLVAPTPPRMMARTFRAVIGS